MACGIFPNQGSACVPCIGRWILIHWTTREVLKDILNKYNFNLNITPKKINSLMEDVDNRERLYMFRHRG